MKMYNEGKAKDVKLMWFPYLTAYVDLPHNPCSTPTTQIATNVANNNNVPLCSDEKSSTYWCSHTVSGKL